VLNPNRYKQIPGPGPDRDSNSGSGPDFGPNINPSFSPFDNLECITYSQMNLVNEMRYLWLQLVIWTRAYISSSVARQGAVPTIYERLHSVPTAFYNYMNLFFGQATAEQFINLMSQYIIIFANVIGAMAVGNQQAANTGRSAWYGNVNDIARLLVQMNGYWSYNQWQDLINRMTTMIIDETVAIFSANYSREIAIYDRLQYQSLLIADYMSRGVMNSLLGNSNNRSRPENQKIYKG